MDGLVFGFFQFLADFKFFSIMETLQNSCTTLFKELLSDRYGDVGITRLLVDRDNRLAGWSFLLPLDYFRDPANAHYLKGIPSSFLLGCLRSYFHQSVIEKILSASNAELCK
jgi:hypothetical protein